MSRKIWIYSPRKLSVKVPESVKRDVTDRAEAFIRKTLAPRYVRPFDSKKKEMQCVGFATKWRKNFFYLAQEFKDTRDDVIDEEYGLPFARLEYRGRDQFLCSYMRHTDEWVEFTFGQPVSLTECFTMIAEDDHFAIM